MNFDTIVCFALISRHFFIVIFISTHRLLTFVNWYIAVSIRRRCYVTVITIVRRDRMIILSRVAIGRDHQQRINRCSTIRCEYCRLQYGDTTSGTVTATIMMMTPSVRVRSRRRISDGRKIMMIGIEWRI